MKTLWEIRKGSTMLNKIFPLSLLFLSLNNSALECIDADIKYTFNKKVIKEVLPLCYSESTFFSKNCKDKKCLALNVLEKSIDKTNLISTVGSPLFEVCRRLGGAPKLFSINIKNQWKDSSYCYYEKDKSFISLDHFNEYLEDGKKDISITTP